MTRISRTSVPASSVLQKCWITFVEARRKRLPRSIRLIYASGASLDCGERNVCSWHHGRTPRLRVDGPARGARRKGAGRQESPAGCAHAAPPYQALTYRIVNRSSYNAHLLLDPAFMEQVVTFLSIATTPESSKYCNT